MNTYTYTYIHTQHNTGRRPFSFRYSLLAFAPVFRSLRKLYFSLFAFSLKYTFTQTWPYISHLPCRIDAHIHTEILMKPKVKQWKRTSNIMQSRNSMRHGMRCVLILASLFVWRSLQLLILGCKLPLCFYLSCTIGTVHLYILYYYWELLALEWRQKCNVSHNWRWRWWCRSLSVTFYAHTYSSCRAEHTFRTNREEKREK